MLTVIRNGNIFNSNMQTLVNPVNCAGVMSEGLALDFKIRYPRMFVAYRSLCESNALKPGQPCLFCACDPDPNVLLFPTKNDRQERSRLEWIDSGLRWFVNNYERHGITSAAFPLLGYHRSGIPRNVVIRMIKEDLSELPIPMELYV